MDLWLTRHGLRADSRPRSSRIGGHQDPMAITERDRIRKSKHRHAAPNADSVRLAIGAPHGPSAARRAASSGSRFGEAVSSSRHDRTFIPRWVLHRHAVEPMVHRL